MVENDEYVQRHESNSWYNHEVDGDRFGHVVLNERAPSLRRRARSKSFKVTRYCRLGELDSQHEQLAMDSWRAPKGILTSDAGDEVAVFTADPGSAAAVFGDPAPVQPITGAVPSKYGIRLNDRNRAAPPGAEPRQKNPEHSVRALELNPPVSQPLLQRDDLLTQCDDLALERNTRAEKVTNKTE